MAALPPDVRAAAHGRYSVLSRRQLRTLGYSDATIDHWLACGLLVRSLRGQYLVGGAAPHEIGRLVTALERSGPGARIGGAWACGLHGLEGFDLSGHDHVIVPPGRRVRGVPFRVVRSPVPAIDEDTVDDVPTITVTRSLIAVSPTHPSRVVRVAFYDAQCRKSTSRAELSKRAHQLGRVYGASEMRRLLATGAFRYESEGEYALSRIWRPEDPLPEPQVWVMCGARSYRLDFAYLDARLCLEYDSKEHHSAELNRLRDTDRDLALAELQIQTLRITGRMLRVPGRTRERILRVREQRLALDLPPLIPCSPPEFTR